MSARVNANDNSNLRPVLMFLAMFAALAAVGLIQSWSLALAILNLCLISAVMSLGVNIQWGYAGLFNVGIMGFAALGGVAGILMSVPPVTAAWQAGGGGIAISLVTAVATILAALFAAKRIASRGLRHLVLMVIIVAGYFLTRAFFDPAVEAIEAVEPAKTGFLGGLDVHRAVHHGFHLLPL